MTRLRRELCPSRICPSPIRRRGKPNHKTGPVFIDSRPNSTLLRPHPGVSPRIRRNLCRHRLAFRNCAALLQMRLQGVVRTSWTAMGGAIQLCSWRGGPLVRSQVSILRGTHRYKQTQKTCGLGFMFFKVARSMPSRRSMSRAEGTPAFRRGTLWSSATPTRTFAS